MKNFCKFSVSELTVFQYINLLNYFQDPVFNFAPLNATQNNNGNFITYNLTKLNYNSYNFNYFV